MSGIDPDTSTLQDLPGPNTDLAAAGSMQSLRSPSLILQALLPCIFSLCLLIAGRRLYRLTTVISTAFSSAFVAWALFINLETGVSVAGWSGEVAALTIWSTMVGAGLLGALLGYQLTWWGAHVTGRLCLGVNAGLGLAFSILLLGNNLTIRTQVGQWIFVGGVAVMGVMFVLYDHVIGPQICIVLEGGFLLFLGLDLFINRARDGAAIGLRLLLDRNPAHSSLVVSYHPPTSTAVLIACSWFTGAVSFFFQYKKYRTSPFGPVVPADAIDEEKEFDSSGWGCNGSRDHIDVDDVFCPGKIKTSKKSNEAHEYQAQTESNLSSKTLIATPTDPSLLVGQPYIDGCFNNLSHPPKVLIASTPEYGSPPALALSPSVFGRYRRTPNTQNRHPGRAPIQYTRGANSVEFPQTRRFQTVDEVTEANSSRRSSIFESRGAGNHSIRALSLNEEYLNAVLRLASGDADDQNVEMDNPKCVKSQTSGKNSTVSSPPDPQIPHEAPSQLRQDLKPSTLHFFSREQDNQAALLNHHNREPNSHVKCSLTLQKNVSHVQSSESPASGEHICCSNDSSQISSTSPSSEPSSDQVPQAQPGKSAVGHPEAVEKLLTPVVELQKPVGITGHRSSRLSRCSNRTFLSQDTDQPTRLKTCRNEDAKSGSISSQSSLRSSSGLEKNSPLLRARELAGDYQVKNGKRYSRMKRASTHLQRMRAASTASSTGDELPPPGSDHKTERDKRRASGYTTPQLQRPLPQLPSHSSSKDERTRSFLGRDQYSRLKTQKTTLSMKSSDSGSSSMVDSFLRAGADSSVPTTPAMSGIAIPKEIVEPESKAPHTLEEEELAGVTSKNSTKNRCQNITIEAEEGSLRSWSSGHMTPIPRTPTLGHMLLGVKATAEKSPQEILDGNRQVEIAQQPTHPKSGGVETFQGCIAMGKVKAVSNRSSACLSSVDLDHPSDADAGASSSESEEGYHSHQVSSTPPQELTRPQSNLAEWDQLIVSPDRPRVTSLSSTHPSRSPSLHSIPIPTSVGDYLAESHLSCNYQSSQFIKPFVGKPIDEIPWPQLPTLSPNLQHYNGSGFAKSNRWTSTSSIFPPLGQEFTSSSLSDTPSPPASDRGGNLSVPIERPLSQIQLRRVQSESETSLEDTSLTQMGFCSATSDAGEDFDPQLALNGDEVDSSNDRRNENKSELTFLEGGYVTAEDENSMII